MAKVLVELLIFFDPVQTEWTTYDQFESSYAKFLDSIGLEGETVQTIGGAVSRKIILIKKKQEVAMPTTPSVFVEPSKASGRSKSIKGQIESLKIGKTSSEERDFKRGKLLKRKGYLKK